MKEHIDHSKRHFLKATGWTAAGLTILFHTGCSLPALPTTKDDPDGYADSWLQILDDGNVRLYVGKAEMGQGVFTGIAQLVANELSIGMHRIDVVAATTNDIPPVRMTVGSESINTLYLPIRRAAARLRKSLIAAATGSNSYASSDVELSDHGIVISSSDLVIPYRDALEKNMVIYDIEDSDLSDEGPSVLIGKSVPRVDLLEKITGAAKYSHDIQLPDMLHGHVLAPPAFGAHLVSADASRARQMNGVHSVVVDIDNSFVGVVANSRHNAILALSRVDSHWDISDDTRNADIDAILDVKSHATQSSGQTLRTQGEEITSLNLGGPAIDRQYQTPFAAHAPMETNAAVATISNDSADIWTSTQDTFYHRALVAEITGLDKSAVTVHNTVIGGAFGGKVRVEAVIDAAKLSLAAGKPVKVIWSREDSFRRGYFRSPSAHHIQASLNSDGTIESWRHNFTSGPIIYSPSFLSYSPSFLSGVVKWATSFMTDQGATRGSNHPYSIKHQKIKYWNVELPVDTGAWRGLGSFANAFAIESAMDELAEISDSDPLEFRLRQLAPNQHRLTRVLQRVAERSNWQKPTSVGVYQGIACSVYKDETYVAVVAEVRRHPSGKITLERLVCAHDCGRIINPDLVMSQIEGNLVWGVSTALKEELTLEEGRFNSVNYNSYELARMSDCPQIDIELIEDSSQHPTGSGEAALMPTPAAIANAYSRALGRRVTSLPIRT